MTTTQLKEFADRFGITLMNESQAALPRRLRDLHRAVLSAFISGQTPTTAWIADRARDLDLDPGQAFADLARADLMHTAKGQVTVAYPFSGVPTPHRVELDGGASSWAMCGGDALGIPLMAGRDGVITSVDAHTGEPIRITLQDGRWTWEPAAAVMLIAAVPGKSTAAEAACRHVHFFTGHQNAHAYLRARPELDGDVYDQDAAIEAGGDVFGPLLDSGIDEEVERAVSVIRTNINHLDFVPVLYRLLAEGEPVSVERLAAETGRDAEQLRVELTRHPGTDLDGDRIAGFNLTLKPTPHRVTMDDTTVYAFCATGALEILITLGRPGTIDSPCAATGTNVHVEVTPDGIALVDPPQAVVSKIRPAEALTDVRRDVCGLGHFFGSPDAAADWLARNPEGRIDPVTDEFEITRRALREVGWAN